MNLADQREPVATYDKALWWLIGQWVADGETRLDSGPLPIEAQLVCLMFWVNETQFRRDVSKRQCETFPAPAPRPRRWR